MRPTFYCAYKVISKAKLISFSEQADAALKPQESWVPGTSSGRVRHMNHNILRFGKLPLVMAALFSLGVQSAPARNVPLVSGSYEVLQKTALGSQTQIRIRIHLVNHGPHELSIQRLTLWDSSHPEKGGSIACAVALPAHNSAETTQEFTIPQSEFQMWQRGLRPRFILQIGAPGKTIPKSTTVVRLERISGQEAK